MARTAICTIMKDESMYADEWLDYHFCIGIDDIFIYQNDWRYSGKHLDDSRLHLVEFDGLKKQLEAYNSFLADHPKGIGWTMFIDADEFLVLKQHSDAHELFNDYEDYFSLGLNWKLFGSNGHIDASQGYSCIERFTRSQHGVNQHIKTALNVGLIDENRFMTKVSFVNPHFVNLALVPQCSFTVAIGKDRFLHGPFNKYGSDDIAYLAHYVTKSREECKTRRSGRRSDTGTPRPEGWESFFNEHDRNDIENLDVLNIWKGMK